MQLLIPVVSMAAFAAVVAGILAWVSKVLTLEGEAQVKVANNGHVFALPLGTNLLSGLGEAGYALMAQCGGGGTCATCRIKAVSGIDEPNAAMLGPISPKLQKEGWILSCQTTLMGDVEIELFDALVQSWPESITTGAEGPGESAPAEQLPAEVAALREVLPGFDCGACGYPTCARYAEALVAGEASGGACLPGGPPVRERLQTAAQAAGIVSLSPEAQALRGVLPGFDCGACGYPTCARYAEALVAGEASGEACLPGGPPVRERLQAAAQAKGVTLNA